MRQNQYFPNISNILQRYAFPNVSQTEVEIVPFRCPLAPGCIHQALEDYALYKQRSEDPERSCFAQTQKASLKSTTFLATALALCTKSPSTDSSPGLSQTWDTVRRLYS